MANERELYPPVSEFLKNELGCTETKYNAGTSYGRIDVLGFRERKSHFASQAEVVAVEVKEGTRFLNYIGQAIAYSLYSHRVYLALKRPDGQRMTQDDIDIASRIGVGLLSISCENEINLVATSNEFDPEHYRLLQVIDKLGYFECTMCRSYYPKNPAGISVNEYRLNVKENPDYRGKLAKAVAERKGAVYWLYELAEVHADAKKYVYDRRFICKDCGSIFSSFLPQEIL